MWLQTRILAFGQGNKVTGQNLESRVKKYANMAKVASIVG